MPLCIVTGNPNLGMILHDSVLTISEAFSEGHRKTSIPFVKGSTNSKYWKLSIVSGIMVKSTCLPSPGPVPLSCIPFKVEKAQP